MQINSGNFRETVILSQYVGTFLIWQRLLGIVSNFCFQFQANLSERQIFIPSEIIRKSTVF